MKDNQKLGQQAEKLAAKELKKRGYKILKRNVKSRYGEIDIVAKHNGMLVVVEVKAGSMDGDFGPPELRVNHAKRKKLRVLALDLLQKYKLQNTDIRFDVVSVLMGSTPPKIRVIESAFE